MEHVPPESGDVYGSGLRRAAHQEITTVFIGVHYLMLTAEWGAWHIALSEQIAVRSYNVRLISLSRCYFSASILLTWQLYGVYHSNVTTWTCDVLPRRGNDEQIDLK